MGCVCVYQGVSSTSSSSKGWAIETFDWTNRGVVCLFVCLFLFSFQCPAQLALREQKKMKQRDQSICNGANGEKTNRISKWKKRARHTKKKTSGNVVDRGFWSRILFFILPPLSFSSSSSVVVRIVFCFSYISSYRITVASLLAKNKQKRKSTPPPVLDLNPTGFSGAKNDTHTDARGSLLDATTLAKYITIIITVI